MTDRRLAAVVGAQCKILSAAPVGFSGLLGDCDHALGFGDCVHVMFKLTLQSEAQCFHGETGTRVMDAVWPCVG